MKPKGYLLYLRSLPLDPVLSQFESSLLPYISSSSRYILILSHHLCLSFLARLLSSGFLNKLLYVFLLSPIHTTCSTHFLLLYSVTPNILAEGYKLWSCTFLCKCLCRLCTSCKTYKVFSISDSFFILTFCDPGFMFTTTHPRRERPAHYTTGGEWGQPN